MLHYRSERQGLPHILETLFCEFLLILPHPFSTVATTSQVIAALLRPCQLFSSCFTSSHLSSTLFTSSHLFSTLLASSHLFSTLLASSHLFSATRAFAHLCPTLQHISTSVCRIAHSRKCCSRCSSQGIGLIDADLLTKAFGRAPHQCSKSFLQR